MLIVVREIPGLGNKANYQESSTGGVHLRHNIFVNEDPRVMAYSEGDIAVLDRVEYERYFNETRRDR